MKTLAELQTEVELGLTVYPTSNHDISVFLAEGSYIIARAEKHTPVEQESAPGKSHGHPVIIGGDVDEEDNFLGGGVIFDDGYTSFEALLVDWPTIASQRVWLTAKTPERIEFEAREQAQYAIDAQRTTFILQYDVVQQPHTIGGVHRDYPYRCAERVVTGRQSHVIAKDEEEALYLFGEFFDNDYPFAKGYHAVNIINFNPFD